jgi:hypothetical protein
MNQLAARERKAGPFGMAEKLVVPRKPVISDRGKGDRPVGKLGGKSLRWLGKTPVRSARETSNSTGRRENEPVKPRKPSVRLKRMTGNFGSAEP